MESICRLCFQPAALFQVPGYNLPTCVKCSEHLTTNGIPPNFYQNIRQEDSESQSSNSAAVSTRIVLQEQSQSTHSHLHQQQISSSPQCQSTSESQSSPPIEANRQLNQTSEQNGNKKSGNMPFDLEKSIQNLDVDLLFNEEGSCPLCSKTFSRKSSLLTHIRNHSAERKYICTYCQKGFTQAANLRNHERIHTNDRPYVCIDCGKAFTQITNLNNHRRLHTGERPFVCIEPECGRSFAQVTNLNNHMKTHHKVQQYCCNQCPKKFTQVTSLNHHLQAHAGVTGFFCPRCPEKSFKQQSQLQTHMKTHGLAFPYECQKCDEKFLQQAHLDQHNKMHDEFKFKCDMCPSSFNQEILLKKHIQRHIEGRYITCPVANCNQGFTVKQHLSKHLLTRHSHSELPPPKRSKKTQQQQQQQQQHHHQQPQHHPIHIIGNSITMPEPGQTRGRPPKKKINVISNTPIVLQNIQIKQEDPIEITSTGLTNIQHNGGIHTAPMKSHELIEANSHEAADNEDTKCQDCGVVFPSETDLRDHIFFKHPERRFMQAVLEENKYLMRMQSQQTFICNLCCNVFKSHLSLVRHTAKFHGQLL